MMPCLFWSSKTRGKLPTPLCLCEGGEHGGFFGKLVKVCCGLGGGAYLDLSRLGFKMVLACWTGVLFLISNRLLSWLEVCVATKSSTVIISIEGNGRRQNSVVKEAEIVKWFGMRVLVGGSLSEEKFLVFQPHWDAENWSVEGCYQQSRWAAS